MSVSSIGISFTLISLLRSVKGLPTFLSALAGCYVRRVYRRNSCAFMKTLESSKAGPITLLACFAYNVYRDVHLLRVAVFFVIQTRQFYLYLTSNDADLKSPTLELPVRSWPC